MKFNYKKIASVLASAVMLTSTVGFAAAAKYPVPFTDGSAVVYGSNAAGSDISSAVNIFDQLKDRVGGGGTDATVAGEAKPVETSSQPLYFGDYMNTTKQTFSDVQLPTVLADGTVTDDNGKELDYELKVDTPNTTIIYGVGPDSLDEPVIYADFSSKNFIYRLAIVFPTAVNATLLTDEAIRLFGKDYVFSGKSSDLTNQSVVLFDKTTSVTINDGESVTVEGHQISVAVEDADTVAITIDGVTESQDEDWSGKIGGVDIYIKNVVGPNVATTTRNAEIFLNSNKITLTHGNAVSESSDDIDGTLVQFSNSGTKVTRIEVMSTPNDFGDDIEYLKIGDSFIDPTFDTLKFEMADVTPDLMADERDVIEMKASSDEEVAIKFTNAAGKEYNLDIATVSPYAGNASYDTLVNVSCDSGDCTGGNPSGTHTYNFTQLGIDRTSNDDLIVRNNERIDDNDYFLTCSNEYTQIWKLESVTNSSKGEVKVKDQGAGSSIDTISLSSQAPGATGSLTVGDGSTVTLTLLNSTAINVTSGLCDWLYTKKGAKIHLSYMDTPINTSGGGPLITNMSQIIIEEETPYNGGSFTDHNSATLGKNISVRWAHQKASRSGKQMFVRDVMTAIGSGGLGTENTDWWKGTVNNANSDSEWVTKYGTFLTQAGGDDDVVSVYYPEDAASLGFYIGEITSEISPGNGGGGGGQISFIKDSEASAVTDKHLIVIGGSCVNTVAAQLLGSSSPLCGADFTAATQVGAGGYIIKSYDSPYADGKTAMLVAGYDASDTINAVKRAMVIDGVTTDVDSEEIFPVVAA